MTSTHQLFQRAFQYHQSGNTKKADQLYSTLLKKEPAHAEALHLKGVIAYEKKQYDIAKNYIKKALKQNPDSAVFHYNMALVYIEKALPEKAVFHLERSAELKPDDPKTPQRLGLVYHNIGDVERAAHWYEKSLMLKEDQPEIWNNLGNIARFLHKNSDALLFYRRAIELNPKYVDVYNNMGVLLSALNRLPEAESILMQACELKPGFTKALINLGDLKKKQKDFAAALTWYQQVEEASGKDKVLLLQNRGMCHRKLKQTDQAVTCFLNVIKIQSDFGPAYQQLHELYMELCRWQEADNIYSRLCSVSKEALDQGEVSPEAPFITLGASEDPDYIQQVTRSWSQFLEDTIVKQHKRFEFNLSDKKEKQKITLGYYSCNFKDHANAHLISGLFEAHDRTVFQVNCYSYGDNDDSYFRHKIVNGCDRFVDMERASTLEAALAIYQDEVDILIDLTGYTQGGRMDVCALKPAPVQIRYLGFPGSMQASFFDYLITDNIVIPRSEAKWYTEKLLYMPECYQINDPLEPLMELGFTRSSHGLPETGMVFCSFSTGYKLERIMFGVWMSILKQVPGSVLWLMKQNDEMVANLSKEAKTHGVDANRLVFAKKIHKVHHLSRMQLADLALDTRLVTGHLTASDALRAGVPVLTLAGDRFISRPPASILTHVGLPDMVTQSLQEYEDKAVRLGNDPTAIKTLKDRLIDNREIYPLFDYKRFVAHYESGLKMAWDQYLKGLPPDHIEVPPLSS